jgi:hypothetical protein
MMKSVSSPTFLVWQRVDDAGASEEVTTDEHFKIPCVTDALQEVTIECF